MTPEEIYEPDRHPFALHPRWTTNLLGQEAAEAKFLTAVRGGRTLHAWLVTGPKGVGKATLTWKIAQFLMVRSHHLHDGVADPNPQSLAFDPKHVAAHRVRKLSELSLSLVRRSMGSSRKTLGTFISIDDIRNLGRQFSLCPPAGHPLIAIIDSADEMNIHAANSLLKLLEEPPENAFMFLISHSPDKLLPTIRSRCGFLRCQSLNIANLNDAVYAALLASELESYELASGKHTDETKKRQIGNAIAKNLHRHKNAIVELAGGSVGAAIELLAEDGRGIIAYSRIVDIFQRAPKLPKHEFYKVAAECDKLSTASKSHGSPETTYASNVNSILQLLSRLAMRAAGVKLGAAVKGEEDCFMRLCKPRTAEVWSRLNTEIAGKYQHAKLVSLNPTSVVLDMFFQIGRVAKEVAD